MEPVHQPTKTKETKNNKMETDAIKSDIINLESLRKIIVLSSTKNSEFTDDVKKWQSILFDLLQALSFNNEIGNEIILLASHAYLSIQRTLCTPTDFENKLITYLNLEKNLIIDYNKVYSIRNVELFKLIICQGFVQLGNNLNCSHEIYKIIFKTIYPHCIRYTRYTYFAFKILETWMGRTSKLKFWSDDTSKLEERLEAVIFSNWDNTICKANVVTVFAAYLNVMKDKYDNFLPYLFYSCVERISWCHVTKYVILAEICESMDNIDLITESKFISNLFNSLTINHLCNASTKVYRAICKKLTKDVWKTTFGEHIKNYVITWESERKYSILQVLWKNWIEPMIKVYRDILSFLLECCDEESILYQSHLIRLANKYGVDISWKFSNSLVLLDHEEEFVRLNAFAAHCYEVGNLNTTKYSSSVEAVKNFLYFNATTDSSYLREGTFSYFKIFFSNLLKSASSQKDLREVIPFLDWFYEFYIDCFEIGSCYQRKIFGLHLYKISLQFLFSNKCKDAMLTKDPNFKEAMKYGSLLRNEMENNETWKFTDKQSVVMLFKLILDPAIDIKETSAAIITDFFCSDVITDSEKAGLVVTAFNKCNSCKIFDIDSGAFLLRVIVNWFPLRANDNVEYLKADGNFKPLSDIDKFNSYPKLLYEEAAKQLILMKKDILKAATQGTPFYGVVSALLMQIAFTNRPESDSFDSVPYLQDVLEMAEDAVTYFLNAFSSKSSNLEYSSSFMEMGIAIDEAIKSSEINYEFDELVLSPAQQTLITCIWRSLKVLCELAVEIAKHPCANDSLKRRVGELIVTVSLKCRHKGVIESAGVAIGNLTRYLCKKNKHVDQLEGYLKRLLINDFSTSINLTRRGAGLTIIFHRIVANDVRPERPLLHFAVNLLLESLTKSASIKFEQKEISNYDDPCTMYLHFLKSLVADKQLQPQLSPYLEQICLACFEYMTSQVFTIRNASVQLFGAIVSRLVGQNTGGKSIDFGYGYSINYFATHFPQLAAHVLLNLQACCQTLDNESCRWQNSTNIIHILSLLSKMFFGGCELIDGTSITYVKQIRNCLNLFLSNPMAHVRNLAAKSYAVIVGLLDIEREICQLKGQIASTHNFNRLNGYLYALEYLYEKRDDEIQSTTFKHSKMKSLSEVRKNLEIRSKIESLWNFWTRRSILIQQKKLCYVIEAQLLRLSRKFKFVIEENYKVESKRRNNFDTLFEKTRPGFFDFIDELMNLFMNYISYNENCTMIKTMLDAKCIDFGINFLKYASRNNRAQLMTVIDFAISNFESTHQILLGKINIYANESIRDIFRGKLIELQYFDISRLKTFASKLEGAFPRTIQLSELLTFIHVLSLRGSGTYDLFEDLISCISKEKIVLANYFSYPEILRELIAKGLEILLYNFDHLNAKCRVTPVLASLVLWKDEVSCIREMIRNSVLDNIILGCKLSNGRITDQIIYTALILNLASEKSILGELDSVEVCQFFDKYLSAAAQPTNIFEIENPFDDNNVESYKEESKIINFIVLCIDQKASKGIFTRDTGVYENISYIVFNTKCELLRKMNIDYCNLQDVIDIKPDEYLAHKLKVVNEVYFGKK